MDNRFRVWNKENKAWETREVFCNQNGIFYTMTLNGILRPLSIENYIISHCTGLTAAKSYRGESEADRLIFERDIIRFDNSYVGVIRFGWYHHVDASPYYKCGDYGFYIEWNNEFKNHMLRNDLMYWIDKLEIIGTVFDESEVAK